MVDSISYLMAALGSPVRIMALESLREGGESNVQQLADELDLPHRIASHHLLTLHRAGLLSRRRDGRSAIYAIQDWTGLWLIDQAAKAFDSTDAANPSRSAPTPGYVIQTDTRGGSMADKRPEPTPSVVTERPGEIPGYDYGTPAAASSPLDLEDLRRLKEAAWITAEDEAALREAGEILADQADEMVTFWRSRLAEQPWLAPYSQHPDGTRNPAYGEATKPRFDRWIIDACTRPLDRDWLDYQHEIGLRHTPAKKNKTEGADSEPLVPLRYVLAFTGVVIATARRFLAAKGASGEQLDRLHSAFTKSVMLHVTVWSRAYGDADGLW